jgi:hypothetical protein
VREQNFSTAQRAGLQPEQQDWGFSNGSDDDVSICSGCGEPVCPEHIDEEVCVECREDE